MDTLKILIVDDSETIRQSFSRSLEEAGFSVVTAGNGVEGLKSSKDETGLAAILTDINMPKMDGIAMTKALREDPTYRAMPIIAVTSDYSDQMKEEAKSAGITAFIRKPVDGPAIVAALNTLLKRA